LGDSPVALRLPSGLAALGLVARGPFAVRRIWGDRTAYIYVLLVAASPGIVCFAQEARMYTLAAFFVAGAVLHGYLAAVEGRPRDLVWYGVFTRAAAMTHYFGLVAVGVNALACLAMARAQERSRVKPLGVASVASAVLYLPWALVFARQLMLSDSASHG
jgi:uncharacterized membrane protein